MSRASQPAGWLAMSRSGRVQRIRLALCLPTCASGGLWVRVTPRHPICRAAAALACAAMVPVGAAVCQGVAVLRGVVRDSRGLPLPDVAISVSRDSTQVAAFRTAPDGHFASPGLAEATYHVMFRKPGFGPLTYTWSARADSVLELRPLMPPLTSALDTVVVLGDRGVTRVLGVVVDDDGRPVPEARIDILGTGSSGITRNNGGFLFMGLRPASYVFRSRKIGFEPSTATVQLESGADRELVLRLHRLPVGLAPAEIRERSGYGAGEAAFRDLDQRLRWSGPRNYVLGSEQLNAYRGRGLDDVVSQIGARWDEMRLTGRDAVAPRSIDKAGTSGIVGRGGERFRVAGDACILLNGKRFVRQPLSTFRAEDIELLEVYPAKSEVSGTIESLMHFECEGSGLSGARPNWYVIWLKGSK